MLIGHTSSRWPSLRMLSASIPSPWTSSDAASSTRSRDSLFRSPFATVRCTVHCTAVDREEGMGITRRLVWIALAGQVLFVVSWIVAGALEPGYSHLDQAVSELGAKNAAHPLIVNAGLIVFGLSFVALGVALARVLPSRLAAGLFVAAG